MIIVRPYHVSYIFWVRYVSLAHVTQCHLTQVTHRGWSLTEKTVTPVRDRWRRWYGSEDTKNGPQTPRILVGDPHVSTRCD